MRRAVAIFCVLICVWRLEVGRAAPQADAGATFRVFLKTGQALPSYGNAALAGDRVVFNLIVGASAGQGALQLMSLPVDVVDLDRTIKYSEGIRAAQYAATRGETDYAAMTEEVARALDQLKSVSDKRQRLALAEEARRRLLAWSREHYSYRAENINEMSGLFNEVIADLRAAAGESTFSMDLVAGVVPPVFEPIQPAPTLRESIALALAAASAADVGEDRVAILRAASLAAGDGVADLTGVAASRLADEVRADQEYTTLRADLLARTGAAMARGDVSAVEAAATELAARDRALGERRPELTRALSRDLATRLETTRTFRLALDHYELVRRSLLSYERRTRPALATVDGLTPVLTYIRDMHGMAFDRIERAQARLVAAIADLGQVRPPDELADVHATILSTLHMAREACDRRRTAVITNNLSRAREASSAAAGALLLLARVRTDLAERLFPPKLERE